MRIILAMLLIFVISLSGFAQEGSSKEKHDDDMLMVKIMLQLPPGLATGFGSTERQLNRMGDKFTVALIKVLDEQDLNNPAIIKKVLPLIQASFDSPDIIAVADDKSPKVTLFLLHYFFSNVTEPELKVTIHQTTESIQESLRATAQNTNGLTTSINTVRIFIQEESMNMSSSFTQKHMHRLGDRVSIALIKILDEQELSKPEVVKDAFLAIRTAFAHPSLIDTMEDKKPKVTMFFLNNLKEKMTSDILKTETEELIIFVRTQSEAEDSQTK